MVNIKLTPIALFVLILFVLVLSVVLGKWLPLNLIEEGFVSFQKTVEPNNLLIIPGYSSSRNVYKVYDNVFLDINNGNIIEIQGAPFVDTVDTSGTSISEIDIIPRNGSTFNSVYTKFDKNGKVIASASSDLLGSSINSSYTSWIYPSFTSHTTEPYQVFYMAWNVDTFVHVIDISKNTSAITCQALMGVVQNSYSYDSPNYTPVPLPTGKYKDTSAILNTFAGDGYYDLSSNKNLYVLSDFVRFDKTNGYLIIQTGTGDSRVLTVYSGSPDSYGNAKNLGTGKRDAIFKPTDTSIDDKRLFSPFMVSDLCGNNIVLYMQNGNKTMVSLICQESGDSSLYTLRNVVRFDSNVAGGVDNSKSYDTKSNVSIGKDTDDDTDKDCNDLTEHDRDKAPSLDSIISDYYKQYWYSSKNAGTVNQYSDDFMLKTQMIPPICPACPACQTNTTCTNCGGNGGAGVIGGANVGVEKSVGGIAEGAGKVVGGIAEGAGDVVEGAGKVVGGALAGTGSLAGGALLGAGALVGGVASGVGSAIGGLGQGNHGQWNQGIQGQGIQGQGNQGFTLKTDPTRVGYYSGSNGQPQNVSTGNSYGSYIDKYSYNGALASKGGDPMPVTSDFSKFGR
jgi:hypothetical protein